MVMGGEAQNIDAGDEEKGSAHLLRLASLQRLLLLLLLEGVERVPVPRVRYRRLHHRPHLHPVAQPTVIKNEGGLKISANLQTHLLGTLATDAVFHELEPRQLVLQDAADVEHDALHLHGVLGHEIQILQCQLQLARAAIGAGTGGGGVGGSGGASEQCRVVLVDARHKKSGE